jgi:hypothetical protein
VFEDGKKDGVDKEERKEGASCCLLFILIFDLTQEQEGKC